ncbi:MAG: hypothetical protein KDK30_18170, partial [Leptospiraceae bacterium]|nr:hypothetical protein [Leptospiraceae bacterium]
TGRFIPIVLVLLLTGFGIIRCQTAPLYSRSPDSSVAPRVVAGSRVALFTLIMREVAVSNSQGLNWTAWRDDGDYFDFYTRLESLLKDTTRLEVLPRADVLNHSLVIDGHFPINERFFLNSANLPMVTSAEEEELMLRTARRLETDYFVTVLADHSISKLIAQPATVNCEMTLNLYTADGLLIYRSVVQASEVAEPYDRELSLGELFRTYKPVTAAALDRCTEQLFTEGREKIAREITIQNPDDDGTGW